MPVLRKGGGINRITAALRELDGIEAKVGWFETAHYEDETPVAYVAAIQEFGSGPIPPRPFLRPTVAAERDNWIGLLGEGAKAALDGDETPTSVLEKVGMQATRDIQKTIRSITTPPLSQLTLAARAHAGPNGRITGGKDLGKAAKRVGPHNVSTKPLVWTGQLLQSITSIVSKK